MESLIVSPRKTLINIVYNQAFNILRHFPNILFFGVPKNRISYGRTKTRQYNRVQSKGPHKTPFRNCPKCNEPVRLRFICMNCFRFIFIVIFILYVFHIFF